MTGLIGAVRKETVQMRNMVDIEVVLDQKYIDPFVTIRTKEKTQQVENIISAIENASENEFPLIAAYIGDNIELLSQRDIFRAYTQGRKVMVQTAETTYMVKKTLSSLEEDLNPKRFFRISQSEIINLFKVKRFDINIAGTIGVEFDNGSKSWAARSRVRIIKDMIRNLTAEGRKA